MVSFEIWFECIDEFFFEKMNKFSFDVIIISSSLILLFLVRFSLIFTFYMRNMFFEILLRMNWLLSLATNYVCSLELHLFRNFDMSDVYWHNSIHEKLPVSGFYFDNWILTKARIDILHSVIFSLWNINSVYFMWSPGHGPALPTWVSIKIRRQNFE